MPLQLGIVRQLGERNSLRLPKAFAHIPLQQPHQRSMPHLGPDRMREIGLRDRRKLCEQEESHFNRVNNTQTQDRYEPRAGAKEARSMRGLMHNVEIANSDRVSMRLELEMNGLLDSGKVERGRGGSILQAIAEEEEKESMLQTTEPREVLAYIYVPL